MENKELLHNLSKLGFPLFEVEEKVDVNQTLAEVVKSHDARLLEGFAVLLVNAAKDKDFNYESVRNHLSDAEDKDLLKGLLLLSLSLYKSFNFYFSKDFYQHLSEEDLKRVNEFRNYFVHGHNFKLKDYTFAYERLKNVFMTYLANEAGEVKKQTNKQEDLSLEYALSQVFSPKQKELFFKKVKGDNLTKTEREYFSRTVKKKLLALANPELNRMAQRVLE